MSQISRRLIAVLSSIALLSGVVIVSVEAKVSGPTIDCPFSILALFHPSIEAHAIYCSTAEGVSTTI